jgi:hypothetical protein
VGLKDRYEIKTISCKSAMEVLVKNHYLHRKCPCTHAYGLFDTKTLNLWGVPEMVGCITYGTPSSSPLRKGVCGEEEQYNVIELTRLWIQDGTPKNAESFLIGNTIKLIDKEIIVSYAEMEQGHLGIVYQATNWIYTGLSAKRTNWTVEGLDKHSHTLADKYTSKEIRQKYGDKFTLEDRPRKHRYIYFNTNAKRKKKLLKKLNYPIQPYPKAIT